MGYTNVGKSSLTNALCGAEIFEADMLFATLDPTARKCTLPSGLQVILVDTVGFVSRLPHDLVDAFKSTLEEAACSDIILKIADASDSEAAEQLSVTDEVLNDLGCGDIPQVIVYNKCDRTGVAPYDPDVLLVSAKTGYGLDSCWPRLTRFWHTVCAPLKYCCPMTSWPWPMCSAPAAAFWLKNTAKTACITRQP